MGVGSAVIGSGAHVVMVAMVAMVAMVDNS